MDFENIKISTHVFVASILNLEINLEQLFLDLPVHQVDIPLRLKKKKDIENYLFNLNLKKGTYIRVQYVNKIRGLTSFKRGKKSIANKKYFRNAVTIVMMLENKLINFKVPQQGKIQITGCKSENHAIECIQFFWKTLQELGNTCYRWDSNELRVIIRMVLTNINFNCGFSINREKLDQYFNVHTKYNSLLELSVGYTGVNIKVPFEHRNTSITTMVFIDDTWTKDTILYNDYLELLPEKERTKEIRKKRKNTFLVFHSGTVIMSGMSPEYMRETYNEFRSIITKSRPIIEEQLLLPN